MRIINLEIENVKRVRAVDITPDENLVVIGGDNGQGKSSVIDAITFALGGTSAQKETPRPVRDGETEAYVVADLGDIKVTRTWKGDKSSLRVEDSDGARMSSPQAVLDALVGRLSFDPLALTQMTAKQQRAELLKIVPLSFDPDDLDRQRDRIYDERKEAGQEARRLEGALKTLAPVPDGTPAEEVNATDVIAEIRAAHTSNQLHTDRANAILDADAEVRRAEDALATARRRQTDANEAFAQCDPIVDVEGLEQILTDLEQTNYFVRHRHEVERVKSDLAAAKAEQERHEQRITNLDAYRITELAKTPMPVPGLSFSEDGLVYNNVPFEQASSAEQLRVAIAIAMAANPTLKVMFIKDGSLLDDKSMRLIRELAVEHDYQLWMERVGKGDASAVIIEDGSVL